MDTPRNPAEASFVSLLVHPWCLLGAVSALAIALQSSHQFHPGQLPSCGTRWAQEASGFLGGKYAGGGTTFQMLKGENVRLPVC